MGTATAAPETPDSPKILVGRQAIFDRKRNVFAYELLFRGAADLNHCQETDGDKATSHTLLNAFFEIGLDRVTGGKPAFLNLTRNFFTEMPPIPFNPDSVVLEILEDIPVDDQLVAAVRTLHERGYRVALDDYLFEDKWQPLLPFISLIKVEITEHTMQNMQRLLTPLRKLPVLLLAEKVETQAQFQRLHDLGFDLFQGYFFARPDIISQDQLPESALVLTQLLARLNDPEAEIQDVAMLIQQDPALSFKMLRLVNSAAMGLSRQIDSIQQAVVLLGLERVRAWAILFTMAGATDRPRELLNLGLLRANLCERLSKWHKLGKPETAYTVGLLSILDGILSVPMQRALRELPLAKDLKAALDTQTGDYGMLLGKAMAMETGREQPQDPAEQEALLDIFLESSEAAFTFMGTLE